MPKKFLKMKEYLETYIFKDLNSFFKSKLERFSAKYTHRLVSINMSLNFCELKSLEMSKNPDISKKEFKIILKSILNTKPLIKIFSYDGGEIDCICKYFYLNQLKSIESFYIFKQLINHKIEGYTFSSISKIDCTNLNEINEFWINEQ